MADSRASSALSFTDRDGSASPSLSATPMRSSYAPSDRSFSATSSVTSCSEVSGSRRSSSFGATGRRRGYVRTEGADFAESAKNRESVMSLGSIAHLQYYFARTGLLDGKGGQIAKTNKNGELEIPQLRLSTIGMEGELTGSPVDESEEPNWDVEPQMLPPTVSTYANRPHYVPPPPDMKALKKDLVRALEDALRALESVEKIAQSTEDGSQGFNEIQGMHILDVTTLAIRAARMYYTSHANPARLDSIKSERLLRAELLAVMEILKKYASRKFAGGMREEEKLGILVWVSDVSQMINTETKIEDAERKEREGWNWMSDENGQWDGRNKDRESAFLESLISSGISSAQGLSTLPISLPPFSNNAAISPQDPLLSNLADGRILIQLHNAAIKRSKRQFGTITTHHTDIAKPYRRADNLRYWVKAAEIRWEIKLEINVMDIVYEKPDETVWTNFENAILKWCKAVREEITRDWRAEKGHERNASTVSTRTLTPETFAAGNASSTA